MDSLFNRIFPSSSKTAIVLILLFIGTFSRFFGINYDSGHRIHPDERFLSMVLDSQKLPDAVASYFDTAQSTLNPVNIGHTFYVYGTLPLWVYQGAGWILGMQRYDSVFLVQRGVSAVFDVGLILLIFGFVSRWLGQSIGTLSALMYLSCPVAIQQAHFGTVDSMTTFFCFLAFALMVQFRDSRKFVYRSLWIGLVVGAAMACKLSAVFWFAFYFAVVAWRLYQKPGILKTDIPAVLVFCLSAFLTFRVLQPYAFSGPGLLDISLSETFLNNVRQQLVLAKPSLYYPPAVQWFDRSIFYSGQQLWKWGVGIWFLLPFCFGIYRIFSRKVNGSDFEVLVLVVVAMSIHGLWQSLEPNKYIRYQLPIYPLVYILISFGIFSAYQNLKVKSGYLRLAFSVMFLSQLFWCASFLSIYLENDARLDASHWIMQNVPTGAVLTNETSWDMTLPFSVHHLYPGKKFVENKLEIFEPDNPEKNLKVKNILNQTDYLVMSSLRTWGTLGRLPQYYPQTVELYRSLMNCQLGQSIPECYSAVNDVSDWKDSPDSQFRLVYVGTRYPRIGSFFINDTLAEESFTVYDHSKVFYMAKEKTFDPLVPVQSWGRLSNEGHLLLELNALADAPDLSLYNPHRVCLPLGMARSYGDVCLNPGNTLLSTRRFNRFLNFDAGTGVLSAQSGLTLKEINQVMLPQGWMLPVVPGTQMISLGGAVANDIHGKNHSAHGTFGDHVLGLHLARSDRGLMECSRSIHPELFRATVGGVGLTGLITQVEVQMVKQIASALEVETIPFSSLEEFVQLSEMATGSWDYTVSWFDCMRDERGLFFRGRFSNGLSQAATKRNSLDLGWFPQLKLVYPWSLKIFNEIYFNLKKRASSRWVDYDSFFFPLDGIFNWNRIYGRSGFYQYQCVFPKLIAVSATRELLRMIKKSGQGSFLSILKTFGDRPSAGLMSFPMEGITLALDFPNLGMKTRTLLNELDSIVAEAGGRIYMAKDSRMSAQLFKSSYPNLETFQKFRDLAMSSALSRRLFE